VAKVLKEKTYESNDLRRGNGRVIFAEGERPNKKVPKKSILKRPKNGGGFIEPSLLLEKAPQSQQTLEDSGTTKVTTKGVFGKWGNWILGKK
jgi:hypothetical protein